MKVTEADDNVYSIKSLLPSGNGLKGFRGLLFSLLF